MSYNIDKIGHKCIQCNTTSYYLPEDVVVVAESIVPIDSPYYSMLQPQPSNIDGNWYVSKCKSCQRQFEWNPATLPNEFKE